MHPPSSWRLPQNGLMRARRRLSGSTTITVNVPYALTREQVAGLLTCHTGYRPGLTSRYGQHLIGQVIRRDPDIVNRLSVAVDTASPAYAKALADVDRWLIFPLDPDYRPDGREAQR